MGNVYFLLRQAFKILIHAQIWHLIGQDRPPIGTSLKILHRYSHKILFNFGRYPDMDRPDLFRFVFECLSQSYLPSKVEFLILILPVAYLIDRKPLRQIVFLSCGLTTFGAFVKLFCWDRKSYWLLFIGQVSAIVGQVNKLL